MIRESFKDKIFNSILFARNYVRSKLHLTNQFALYEPDVSKMSLIFEDTFSSIDPSIWRVGQPWGMFHPNTPNQYYGFDSVFTRNNKLVLAQEYNPKQFQTDKTYNIPFSVGLVSSYKTFGYGFYEFNICLPYGSGLWPAVWLTAADSWPPEIDLLEAYSDAFESYGIKLQSNLHYGATPNNINAGARNHPVPSPLEKIKVSCWFTERFIRIYYNGYLVRQITSESILSSFQNKKFMVVLNNGVRPGFEQLIINQYSEFSIYSVRIYE